MNVNVDLIVSGCNTRCRHCYVNGGPGKNMPTEDVLWCIDRLDDLAAALPFPLSFTLDNEPINHPDITAIIRAASAVRHAEYYHHGMTTGIALMRREDKETIVQAYLDGGYGDFGITLHGSPAHHDEIVRREGAFRASVEATAFLQSCGAEISVSLMWNRFFREDAAEIDRTIEKLNPAFVYFAVPNYTPHANMMGYEAYRASIEDLYALSGYLTKWGQDTERIFSSAGQSTPGAVIGQLGKGLSLTELFMQEQDELYLSVHQDALLYLGNTGAETECLGDLRTVDIREAAQMICQARGNRDYGAFYNADAMPDQEKLIRALRKLPQDRLYSDQASVIYRGLEELHVPTRILKA